MRRGVPLAASWLARVFGVGIVGAVIWLFTVDWRYAVMAVLGLVLIVLAIGGYRAWREAPMAAATVDGRGVLLSDLRPLLHEGDTLVQNSRDPAFGMPGRIEPIIGWKDRVYRRLAQSDQALAERFLQSSQYELVPTTDMFDNHNRRSLRDRVGSLREIVGGLEC